MRNGWRSQTAPVTERHSCKSCCPGGQVLPWPRLPVLPALHTKRITRGHSRKPPGSPPGHLSDWSVSLPMNDFCLFGTALLIWVNGATAEADWSNVKLLGDLKERRKKRKTRCGNWRTEQNLVRLEARRPLGGCSQHSRDKPAPGPSLLLGLSAGGHTPLLPPPPRMRSG